MTPLHRQIVVAATAGRAFAVFTTEIGLWWPLERFSVGGAGSSVEFKNGRLVETAADGDTHEWGEVTAWAPPERLAFSWHPGRPDEPASHVEVTFVEVADGTTLVTLTHTGWERLAEPAAAREEYRNGWPLVMARLDDAIGTEPAAPTVAAWFALLHTSNLTPELSVFADDRFAGHVAFCSGSTAVAGSWRPVRWAIRTVPGSRWRGCRVTRSASWSRPPTNRTQASLRACSTCW